jgi:hypothetical protein
MPGVGTAFKGAMLCRMATKSVFMAAFSNLVVAVSWILPCYTSNRLMLLQH